MRPRDRKLVTNSIREPAIENEIDLSGTAELDNNLVRRSDCRIQNFDKKCLGVKLIQNKPQRGHCVSLEEA